MIKEELATHETLLTKLAISTLHDGHWGVQYDSGSRGEACLRASIAATSLGIRIIGNEYAQDRSKCTEKRSKIKDRQKPFVCTSDVLKQRQWRRDGRHLQWFRG